MSDFTAADLLDRLQQPPTELDLSGCALLSMDDLMSGHLECPDAWPESDLTDAEACEMVRVAEASVWRWTLDVPGLTVLQQPVFALPD